MKKLGPGYEVFSDTIYSIGITARWAVLPSTVW